MTSGVRVRLSLHLTNSDTYANLCLPPSWAALLNLLRGTVVETGLSHKQIYAGSNPAPAIMGSTKLFLTLVFGAVAVAAPL